MNDTKNQADKKPVAARKATLLTAMLGAIPTGLGKRLRTLLYPSILGRIHRSSEISVAVELLGTKALFIGEGAKIIQNSSLNAWTENSRIEIGAAVVIDRGVYLQALGGRISIGANSYIGPYVCMSGPGDVSIGDNCLIASHSTLYANNHIFTNPDIPINQQSLSSQGIRIGNDCWLGAGVKIMDGIEIGDGCVIGAGAVVTKNLPPYSVALGVPAVVTSSRK